VADWDGLRRGLEDAVTPPPLNALRQRRQRRRQRRAIASTCALALIGTASGFALLGQRSRESGGDARAGRAAAINQVVHSDRFAPPRNDYDYIVTDFDFVSPTTGWALGIACAEETCRAATWRTDDGGSTWGPEVVVAKDVPRDSYKEQDPKGGGARSLRMIDANEGFAFNPDLYVTHDGARTWTRVPQPSKVSGIQAQGRSVWVTEHGCATDADCAPVIRSGAVGPAFALTPLRVPATRGATLVRRGDALHGYLLAYDAPSHAPGTLHRTADGGATWQPAVDPCPDTVSAALSAGAGRPLLVVCSGDVAADEDNVHRAPKRAFASNDHGTTWRRLPDPPEVGELTDLTALSATTAYATTQLPARLLVTTDGGTTWQPANGASRNGYGYSNLDVADATHAWAMGDQGTLWRTTDGAAWHSLALPPGAPRASGTPSVALPARSAPADKGVEFTGLSFTDPLHGYALGARCDAKTCRPVLRRTDDGGYVWRVAPGPAVTWPANSDYKTTFTGVTFADDRNGWVFGPDLLATHDGGLHWKALGIRTLDVVARDGYAWAVGEECAVQLCTTEVSRSPVGGDTFRGATTAGRDATFAAVDGQHAYLVESAVTAIRVPRIGSAPRLLATADGGRTWTERANPCPNAFSRTVAASSFTDVWVVCIDAAGGSQERHPIAHSTDGGRTWATIDPDTNGIIDRFAAVGPGLAFRAESGLIGGVKVTRDGGRTWRQMPDEGEPQGALRAFGILDGTHGYALYQEDVFLVMTDGASWHRMTRP
jgi:photosystem II stability/assembly factor-like uncharacterized protein